MNKVAEKHLTKAKLYLAQGDELYRKAKGEIDAAIAAGASQREVSRYLLKSQSWVRDVIAWDGTGTLYGHDTEARQNRQARQVMREAPMEQVEQIIDDLPPERQAQIVGSIAKKPGMEKKIVDAMIRHEPSLPPHERERIAAETKQQVGKLVQPFTIAEIVNLILEARDVLHEMIDKGAIDAAADEQISQAINELTAELEMGRLLMGKEEE
jgi:hypothetical protein